jgi:demethylmenaquinone methyltransferase/2-methoxy-6-polyprenyl-1,4-benzoquinol methylase
LLAPHRPRRILDVATGTADLAIAAARLKPETIVGIDLSEEMLRIARHKIARRGLEQLITLQHGDAEQLAFPDGSFDAVTVAFGIRNFSDLARGLRELHRVLTPGGISVILEFSQPRVFLIRQLYAWYSRTLIPRIGGLISRHREAYEYLPKTVHEFPDGEAMLSLLRSIGFCTAAAHPLTFGIATVYLAQKA